MDQENSDVKSDSLIQETQEERAESDSSDVAVESGRSMAQHGNFNRTTETPESWLKQDRGVSPAVSYLSMKSDRSMGHPGNFKEVPYPHSSCVSVKERVSPAPSCMSMKSDWSMGQPGNFKGEVAYPHSSWMKQDRGVSPAVSYLSMKSDWSMGQPGNFKEVPDPSNEFSFSLLTAVHLKCHVCSSILRDPVSIPCGHSYCKHCINTHWAQPGPTGYFVCLQCEKSYPTCPELSVNVALTWTLQALQQAGFSPACPTLAQAGPGDVACDICSGIKLRAVKICLTCSATYCESHVRQHYTVPALQKHTLAEVSEDTRLKTQGRMEVIKEESIVDSESEEHQAIPSKRMKMAVEKEDEMLPHSSELHVENVSTHLEPLQEKGPTEKVSEMRIVLLGPKRSGKSSSGNTILGREEFGLERTAQCEKKHGDVAGRQITVVDTPGWWGLDPLKYTPELIKQEIVLSASLCAPGPHVLLLVIDEESCKAADVCKSVVHMQLLSKRVWSHTILLFTTGDSLGDKSIEQYIESKGKALQRLVEKCGYRYHVFNNKNRGDGTQVAELLEKIEEMVVAGDTVSCFEIDRRVLEKTEKKRRTEDERAARRQTIMKKERERIRSMGDDLHLPEIRIVLLGSSFSGKSSSGNTILRTEEFGFKITTHCEKRKGDVAGRQVTVADTPGWWRRDLLKDTAELIKQDIVHSASLCAPGPHVFLLVIEIDESCNADVCESLEVHMQLLGERAWRHTIVLFTYGDLLGSKSIEHYLESEGEALQRLVEKCGNRYHVFNNVFRGDGTQVTELLEKIEEMVAENGGGYY